MRVRGSGCGEWPLVLSFLISALTAVPHEFTVVTLAGAPEIGPGVIDGNSIVARFGTRAAVAVDGFGNVYVADNFTQTIRKVAPSGEHDIGPCHCERSQVSNLKTFGRRKICVLRPADLPQTRPL